MLKITRYNSNREEVESLITPEDITGATEIKVKPTKLFDENGKVVSETPNPSIYELRFAKGESVRVSKDTYDKIVANYLKVETLQSLTSLFSLKGTLTWVSFFCDSDQNFFEPPSTDIIRQGAVRSDRG